MAPVDSLQVLECDTGISYRDLSREEHHQPLCIAFMGYDTLTALWWNDCPADMREAIEKDIAGYAARRGEQFLVTSHNQYVTLGHPNTIKATCP